VLQLLEAEPPQIPARALPVFQLLGALPLRSPGVALPLDPTGGLPSQTRSLSGLLYHFQKRFPMPDTIGS